MVDVADTGQRIEDRDDLGTGDVALWAYWKAQEQIVDREESKWVKRGRKIIQRYRDERPDTLTGVNRLNILWSNVQTLGPVLYGRTPKPDVERRFKDQDDVGRLAATLLERTISQQLESFGFDDVMKAVVQDRLLPGRGVARVLYIPHYGDEIEPEEPDVTNEEFEDTEAEASMVDNPGDAKSDAPVKASAVPLREVVFEETIAEYVFWEDYREGAARTWREVPWTRYRSYMTREQMIARFGKKVASRINLDFTPKGASGNASKDDPPQDVFKKAVIHETWDKEKKEVVWWPPGTPDVIADRVDDPLELPDFFPSCDPLLATVTNDKRIPVPDYAEYQDQASELDNLTARIDRLQRAIKVSGVYPGELKQVLQQLVDEGTENKLIPVEDWAAFGDKGGMEGIIQWLPIKQIAETLIQLYSARDKTKQLLYEITGIGDIMRGASDPNETMGAQALKAAYSQRRVAPQQKDVAKFARDIIRLMGAIVAIHFSSKTISMITGYPQLKPVPQLPPQPQQFLPPAQPSNVVPMQSQTAGPVQQPMQPPQPQPNPAFAQWTQLAQQAQAIAAGNQKLQQEFDDAVALLKSDWPHGFKLDIEADSTIAADEQQEKQSRTEFLGAMVPLLEQLVPIAQGNPAMAAVCKELALFGARGFKVARSLEETLENAFDAISQMPPNPKASGQDGKGAANATDSPQAIAERKYETDSRLQIAREQNAAKVAETTTQAQLEERKLAVEQSHNQASLVLDAAKADDESRFRDARATALQSREASGLA